MSGVNPQAARRAKNEYGKYSPNIDGLRQAIGDWGGMVMVDKAVEFVDSHPRVKGYLQKAGIDPVQIRAQLQNSQSSTDEIKSPEKENKNGISKKNVYRDRLSKLR